MRLLLLICSCVVPLVFGGSAICIEQRDGQGATQSLQLSTRLISERYCTGASADLLKLDLRLHYTNVSSKTVILHRGADTIVRQRVSLTLEDAILNRFVYDASLTVFMSGGFESLEGAQEVPKSFVVLPPGSSFDTNAETTILLPRRGRDPKLSPGDYYLQITVSTWHGTGSLAESLRGRWANYGVFWYGNITSDPMQFTIQDNQPHQDCSPFAELRAEARSNPNAKDSAGFTALMAAVSEHDLALFSELLQQGADVNSRTEDGLTALIVAAIAADERFMTQLIERGADVNARMSDGTTALMLAAEKCDDDIVALLLGKGVDVNLRDKQGNTAIKRAAKCGKASQRTLQLLTRAGALQ